MNEIDAAVLLIMGIAAVRGYVRGLLRESFGAAGLVCGIIAGLGYSQQLAQFIVEKGWLRPVEAPFVAAPVLFVAVYFVATMLGLLAHRVARALLLGGVDRAGGVLSGLLRGVALCGLLLALAAHILPKDSLRLVETSRFGKPLTDLGMWIVDAGRRLAPETAGRSV